MWGKAPILCSIKRVATPSLNKSERAGGQTPSLARSPGARQALLPSVPTWGRGQLPVYLPLREAAFQELIWAQGGCISRPWDTEEGDREEEKEGRWGGRDWPGSRKQLGEMETGNDCEGLANLGPPGLQRRLSSLMRSDGDLGGLFRVAPGSFFQSPAK